MNPNYPVYIVSKGRAKNMPTARSLDEMGVPYKVVVEASEANEYANYTDPKKLLILPQIYLDEYDTFDNLPEGFGQPERSKGPGAARNFVWDHATQLGYNRHWVMDDNLAGFYRLNRNLKIKVASGTILRAAEDFVDRYENVYLAGINYFGFCKKTDKVNAYTKNTRIYSCLLIQNDIPYHWRGRYNEDTDLSLRILKDGYCTIQFNAFLCDKVTTQRMAGGNTKEFYKEEGTYPKSKMLEDMHPDVTKVVKKFGRWHHSVDYSSFKANELIKKEGVVIPTGIDNYGMKIIDTLTEI